MKRLTKIERETLERLASEYGVKTLSEHTGLSTRVLAKGLEEDHNLSDSQYEALVLYLQGHV